MILIGLAKEESRSKYLLWVPLKITPVIKLSNYQNHVYKLKIVTPFFTRTRFSWGNAFVSIIIHSNADFSNMWRDLCHQFVFKRVSFSPTLQTQLIGLLLWRVVTRKTVGSRGFSA